MYSDGVLEVAEREMVKRVVVALEVDTARAKEILTAAREEQPARGDAGPADRDELWAAATRLLRALPPGSGRRALATRVGWALEVDEAQVAQLVRDLLPGGAEPPAATASLTEGEAM